MEKFQKIRINNLLYPGFNFIIIDILRMFNDPLSSYWRINKNGKRALKLFKYYSLNLNDKFFNIKYDNNINDYIRKELIIGSNLIVIGYYAFNYFKNISLDKTDDLYVPYYEAISTDFIIDVDNITIKLQKNLIILLKNTIIHFINF